MSSRKTAMGFTLVELVVVTAIIAALIAMLVPSLGKARAFAQVAVCASNLKQWGLAYQMYAQEQGASMPLPNPGSIPAQRDDLGTWYNALPKYIALVPYNSIYTGVDVGSGDTGYRDMTLWFCPTRLAQNKKYSASGGNSFHYPMNTVIDGTGIFPWPGPGSAPKHISLLRIKEPAASLIVTESDENQPWVRPNRTSPISFGNIDPGRHVFVSRQPGDVNVLFADWRVERLPSEDVQELHQDAPLAQRWGPRIIWGPFP